jgi:cell division protein FtsI (penicillin-binding protein 3)
MTNSGDQPPEGALQWKVGVFILVFVCAFLVIAGRLFWVQVVEASHYREIARKQYESKVVLRAERGKMYDRKMRLITSMIGTTSFAADPTMVERPQSIAQLLSNATSEPEAYYRNKISQSASRFVWLARGLNTVMFPELEKFKDKGLIRIREPKRQFLYGSIASQVVGTTDVDNNGLTGLELQYNHILQGESGFVVMARDARGRLSPIINPERKAPTGGKGLHLTIDIEFQSIVEEELHRGVVEMGAASGTIIAIEPSTGEVLAMASVPTYDASRLHRTTNDAIRIRGVSDQYEPGSTIKAITAAAAIEERLISPTDVVQGHNGVYSAGSYTITDEHPLGQTTFFEAMKQSSNIVFANVARSIDNRVFYKYVRNFGFGIPTGIDVPGEAKGKVSKPNETDVARKMSMGYGYGLASTALQMVNAYATIANNGTMMLPHVVKGIAQENGQIETEVEPTKIRTVVSAKTAAMVRQMLIAVVDSGTGQAARIAGLPIAGKTGTAQQLQDGQYNATAYTASFVGFYPAYAPRVAMIVMLDRPTTSIYGGAASAPIFKRIVQKTMTLLELDAESNASEIAGTKDSVVVPDVRGLQVLSADTLLQQLQLRSASTLQRGVVVRQFPMPAQTVPRGTSVQLYTQATLANSRPDVRGFSLRAAIAVLHSAHATVKVQGSGNVVEQRWNGNECTIIAMP